MTILEQERYFGVFVEMPSGEVEFRHWGCYDAATKTATGPVADRHCAVCGRRIKHFRFEDGSVAPVD